MTWATKLGIPTGSPFATFAYTSSNPANQYYNVVLAVCPPGDGAAISIYPRYLMTLHDEATAVAAGTSAWRYFGSSAFQSMPVNNVYPKNDSAPRSWVYDRVGKTTWTDSR